MAAVTTGMVAMAGLAGTAAWAECPGIHTRATNNAPAPKTVEAIRLTTRPVRMPLPPKGKSGLGARTS
jgi:hypothetical protein